ncbi:MAG: serine/threonine protein kinase [Myxococcota bacterium]
MTHSSDASPPVDGGRAAADAEEPPDEFGEVVERKDAESVVWDGRYRLIRTLGEGGMGRVVLAQDLSRVGRIVALKILLPEYLETVPEFLHEYAIHRRLSHPNIPRAFELGFANRPKATLPYFAMEYVHGVPLLTAMERRLAHRTIYEIMVSVLRALDHMHRQSIVHCDVKPGNILVVDDRGRSSASLIDYGVSSQIGGFSDTEEFVGTPEYAAPEFMTGRGVDERSDLYAVGLLLYELIEGRRPWKGNRVSELMNARKSDPPPLSAADCPPPLAKLVHQLLDPDPKRRPPDAATTLHLLSQAMGEAAEIEPAPAFLRRLRVLEQPHAALVEAPGIKLVQGLRRSDSNTISRADGAPIALIVAAPPSFEPRALVGRVSERAAILGARVLSTWLREVEKTPLGTLRPALETLGRLYPDAAKGSAAGQHSSVEAASRRLGAVGRPVLLVVEDLQRADAESLEAIYGAVSKAGARVRLIATVNPEDSVHMEEALTKFMGSRGVLRVELAALGADEMNAWVDQAVGPGAVSDSDRAMLLQVARGTPGGLAHGLYDLFRRGRIARMLHGYMPSVGSDRELDVADALEPSGPANKLDTLLACIREPLPEVALRRYLAGFLRQVPHLVSRGLLVRRDNDFLQVDNEVNRLLIYQKIPLGVRRKHHRRLALALEELRGDAYHERIALEYLRSDTPLMAVPHLVRAALRGPIHGRGGVARRYLQRADALLNAHEGRAVELDLWRFWAILWRADARVSSAIGDLDRFEEVVERLFALGTEMAHRQTLRAALELRLQVDARRGYWDRLVDDAGALLSLDPKDARTESLARLRWAKAMRYRADGEIQDALKQLRQGLAENGDALSLDIRLLLWRTLTEMLVDLRWHEDAAEAIGTYGKLAEDGGNTEHHARAQILATTLLRLCARPADALIRARSLAKSLGDARLPGVDAALEWELAACHLEFGWCDSALQHAQQSRMLAEQDGDPSLAVRAHLVEVEALRLGENQDLAWTAVQAVQVAAEFADESARVNARLSALELALDSVRSRELDEIGREAAELGWRAQRRQELARAARAFGLGARAAILMGDGALATQWATLSLSSLERFARGHVHMPRHLWTASRAATLAGNPDRAAVLAQGARDEIVRIVNQIEDETLRNAWLTHPQHTAIMAPKPEEAPVPLTPHKTSARPPLRSVQATRRSPFRVTPPDDDTA